MAVPNRDHSGLALRTFHRSRPISALRPAVLVAFELVVGAPRRERLRDLFGREHAGEHCIMGALDARHIDEARRAADQRAARKNELRHRLPAALGDRARAIADAGSAREGVAHDGMGLEALEFLERREIRVVVIEVQDESDRDEIVAVVIEERAAAGAVVERPAEGVLNEAGRVLVRRDLPQLLQADAEFRRLAVAIEPVMRDQSLAEMAARALGEQRVFAAQFHAAGERVLRLAVLADSHVAGGDPDHLVIGAVEHLGGGEARIDFDAERFRLGREPPAHLAERDDIGSVIAHQRRQEGFGQAQCAGAEQHVEAIVLDRRLDRRVPLAPAGQEPVERADIDHRPGEDVPADLGSLLHHDDGDIGRELLETDRGAQSGGPGADNDHVELHRFAGGQFSSVHYDTPVGSSARGSMPARRRPKCRFFLIARC